MLGMQPKPIRSSLWGSPKLPSLQHCFALSFTFISSLVTVFPGEILKQPLSLSIKQVHPSSPVLWSVCGKAIGFVRCHWQMAIRLWDRKLNTIDIPKGVYQKCWVLRLIVKVLIQKYFHEGQREFGNLFGEKVHHGPQYH